MGEEGSERASGRGREGASAGDERAALEAEVRRLRDENRALSKAVRLLHRVARLVRASSERDATVYAILTGTTAGVGLGFNRAMLFEAARDGRTLHGVGGVGPRDRAEADRVWRSIREEAPELEHLYEIGLAKRDEEAPLDRRVRELSLDAGGDDPIARVFRGEALAGAGDDLGGLLHLPTAVAAPLRGEEGVLGVLYADNRFTEQAPDPVTRMVFSLVADHAGRALESARRFERLAERARTDALTGLPHHGALMKALADAVEAAKASGEPLGLVMIDLDDFKGVNDTHGHPVGDALLAAFARRIREVTRRGEEPFRYGGEEFAVLAPGAGPAAIAAVGERVRAAIAEAPFELEGLRLEVRCSVGVAALPADAREAGALVEAADAAL
ncbi:MAG TPA: GGDEF domain-containing protein, partial [Polyangiaceae bacterium LLY-WYZ-15_(1-7)]|nr:GGDEF domain-containing protein [Polyangiaceae bacterium LLY-WYZ-15_(1-7)]